nr:antitoxin [Rhodoferax sp.]
VIQAALEILRKRFAQDDKTEGYRKDGPVSVAKFELGEGNEPEQRELRVLRQRQASDVIDQLLHRVDRERDAS